MLTVKLIDLFVVTHSAFVTCACCRWANGKKVKRTSERVIMTVSNSARDNRNTTAFEFQQTTYEDDVAILVAAAAADHFARQS
jgi:hypothetical protein